MSEIRVSHDPEARAAYIRLTDNPVARTIEITKDLSFADLDASNRVVGIEVLHVTAKDLAGVLESILQAVEAVAGKIGGDLVVA